MSDSGVLATLSRGYNLQFRRRRPKFSGIIQMIVKDLTSSMALSLKICSLLEKGAITKVPPLSQREGFYSTYYLVTKKDGKLQPILDL